jgi:arginyl-tRNA synthetase
MVSIARHIVKEFGEKYKNISEDEALGFFHKYTENKIMDMIRKDLLDFRVHFKNWVSETELVSSGVVEKALKLLEEKGHIFKEEGAVWFRSTQFGDDKDRVLIKSTGEMTYLVPDIAYHNGKYKRGFNLLVDLWGPDHHGYIPRLKAAMKALGNPAENLNVLIVQLTTLYRNGQQLSMSTRAGEFVSLRDLLDDVGTDAARYYLVMRRPESHLDFDLEIAKKETPDNPVYYIQYAYARITSIFGKYRDLTAKNVNDMDFNTVDISFLKEQEEISLIKFLSQYPEVIEDSARVLGPHLLTDYLEALVSRFHTYYEKHKVVGADENITKARVALIRAVQIVLQNALNVLGVSIPERM